MEQTEEKCPRCFGRKVIITTDPWSGSMVAKTQDAFEEECPNCYGRGVINDEEFKKLDAMDLEIMNSEIEKIMNSNDEPLHKVFLVSTVKLMHGRWGIE